MVRVIKKTDTLPVWNVKHVENLVGVLVLNDAGSNPDRITLAQLVSYL